MPHRIHLDPHSAAYQEIVEHPEGVAMIERWISSHTPHAVWRIVGDAIEFEDELDAALFEMGWCDPVNEQPAPMPSRRWR